MDFELEVNENGLDSFQLIFPLAYRIAFMIVFGKSGDRFYPTNSFNE